MKTINIITILSFALFASLSTKAQAFENNDFEKPQRSSVIYLNAFGNSMTQSLNYDSRFSCRPDAWGASIGVGGFALSGDYFLTVPVQINYLFGEKNNYFEIGAGITYFAGNMRWLEFGNDNKSNSNILGTLSLMYRLQIPNGFFLRTGWTPYFGQMQSNDVYDEFNGNTRLGKSYFGIQPGWFGLGLGYCIR